MDFLIELIERGDACSLIGIVFVLIYIGNLVVARDAWANVWGQRLAVLAFIGFCAYGVVTVGRPDAAELFVFVLRGVLAAGLVLGISWNLLGAVSFLRDRAREASDRAEIRAAQRRSRKREKQEEKRRRREQAEWERTAPERRRRQELEDARWQEEQKQQKLAAQRRKDVLFACESFFLLYAPEIQDRFTRQQFDDFASKYMGSSETPETIESRGKQLQQLIRDHHERVNPPEKFHGLEELATWYAKQKQEVQALPIDDSFKADYLVQLNERYADLTQKVMENLAFDTHFHLIGGTGKGKTTALHTVLRPLLRDPTDRSAFIIIDRLGNLSQEMLLWMASPDFCTDYVRDRLVYIQPSREDVVLPFNPLLYDTRAHGFYKVERATEIILRAWESVNIEAMPRLARWVFNCFWAAAQMGLTIADCVHFLLPGSRYHEPLLKMLPPQLKAEWDDIYKARGGEAQRILDSSRNRLKPYFESDILRRMFGATQNHLDVERFMREGSIVLIDLAPRDRLSGPLGNTIGSLVLNEVIATARGLAGQAKRFPTYVFLDEFQNFVGPDIESALPEVRQLGLKLLLSHQSFSQLERGDHDLTSMIFQAQSRMMFGVQGEDADILSHELAALTFDPDRIKHEIHSRKQLVRGHEIVHLTSWSDSAGAAEQWNRQYGNNWGSADGRTQHPINPLTTRTHTDSRGGSETDGHGRSTTHSSTQGGHETLIPNYEEFRELANRTYVSFDEQKSIWARDVRHLATGEALLRLVDDPSIYHVAVKRSAPGYLRHDLAGITRHFPELLERMQELLARNFESDLFSSAALIDADAEQRLERFMRPTIVVPSTPTSEKPCDPFA
ncbi:TraG-D_C domain-containing protein (Fragment) [Durusdinium trenchii]|uniref:TraD/TraG TraM recognition site domain-containing protein n=2 Tax=Symbiodiniaceae TaxID=252141 RepID=A0A9P1BF94_9DINO|nr:unnamed protein product [Cladocopium goreaui]